MTVDVLVVGAGPAGLSAAAELRRLGVRSVLVADREAEAGGIPRHSWHTGYGLRDLHRVMTGPAYARALAEAAVAAGAEVRLGTTVTVLRAWHLERLRGDDDQRPGHRDGGRDGSCCSPPGAGSGRGRRG